MSFPRQQFLANIASRCADLGRHDVATWITVALANFARCDDAAGEQWLDAARETDRRGAAVLECDEQGEILGVLAAVEVAA